MNRAAPIVRVARGAAPSPVLPGTSLPVALPDAERRYFESRLQSDFSAVRLHTGMPAALAAAARGAKAFTHGADIAFGAGRYQPGTPGGRTLLAHELIHVAQQGRGGSSTGAEARAQQGAGKAARGDAVSALEQGGASQGVQCDDDDKKLDEAMPLPLFMPPPGAFQLTPPQLGGGSARPLRPAFTLPNLWAPFTAPAPPAAPPVNLNLTPDMAARIGPSMATTNGVPLPPMPAVPNPYSGMQAAEILAPFAAHGVTPGTAGVDINDAYVRARAQFSRYMWPGAATFSANMAVPATAQAQLAHENPNVFDLDDIRWKGEHPDEFRLPPLPLLSSSSLTTLYELVTGKKNTHKFYLP